MHGLETFSHRLLLLARKKKSNSILQGKNGGASLQDSISGSQSFAILTGRVSSQQLQGSDTPRAIWEASQTLHFSRLGLRWGTKRVLWGMNSVRWNAAEAPGLRLPATLLGRGNRAPPGIRRGPVGQQGQGRRGAL